MRRLISLLFILLAAAIDVNAQSVADSTWLMTTDATALEPEEAAKPEAIEWIDTLTIATDSLPAPEPSVVEVPDYMRRSVMRSWLKSHPLQPLSRTRVRTMTPRVRTMLDSLRQQISQPDATVEEMRYLYDMRLPIISSGSIPNDSLLPLHALVMRSEALSDTLDLPIPHHEDAYDRQQRYEEHRHLVRFNYASVDPRRFRYARRHFEVPVATQTIDTRTTMHDTRLVDDIDVNFGNADLESFGQYFEFKADRWHWKGDHTLTMQQTALSSNWYNGGDNNMSVSGEQKLTATRFDPDSKITFEAVIDLKLSGYYTKADTIHRMRVSDNELTLNMKYGYKAWKKWYYSAQLYTKTPVFDFYAPNSRVCKTTFLSPLEMNLALGVDYQYTSPSKKFNYSLLLAPLSYDMKYVRDPRVNVSNYKISEGDHSVHNFGSTVTSKIEWKMGANSSWSSRLYYFTTYHAMKVEFENTFNFQISRFFTTRIYLYPRFDDNSDTRTEIKEMLTIGFSYRW